MSIERIVVEVNIEEHPFQAEETLFCYAKRILKEDNIAGMIVGISTRVHIVDVSTYEMRDSIGYEQFMEIEVQTTGMVR